MERSKPKPNPKKPTDGKRNRKVSLPNNKIQSRVCLEDLRENFKRQISLPKEKDIIPLYDPLEKAQESSALVKGKTGIIYDATTNEHFCLWDKNHPENPDRLNCILRRCKELRLFSYCEPLTPVSATVEQIKTLHTEVHYNILKDSKENSIEALKDLSSQYDSIYINQKTFDAALKSAGCCLELTKAVLGGRVQNGMALVRPPGHHASREEFCGYSFFNNVALAASYALSQVEKVLIVDWDVHHGQGTQRFFYDDSRVLYFSSHRYEKGKFWPNLRESNFDYVGSGTARGTTINVPLNQTGMGNAEFLAYFHQVLLPVAYEFCPDVVLVSCGYDAAVNCPEGMMNVTPALFAHLTTVLLQLARGKVVVFLEGGYCLESLSESAMHTLRTLLGFPCPTLIDPVGPPCDSLCESILNLTFVQRPFWKSLRFQNTFDDEEASSDLSSSTAEDQILACDQSQLRPRFIPKLELEGLVDMPPSPGMTYSIVDSYPEYSENEAEQFALELKRLKEGTSLEVAATTLCFVYDSDMEKHYNCVEKSYPERPARTREIYRKLQDFGILERAKILPSRRATLEELRHVHNDSLLNLMMELPNMTPKERNSRADDFNSIYFNEHTCDSALLAAGSLLQVVDCVCTNESQSGLALIRPPGHHAEIATPNGFCFFNNVCVAAKYAMQKYALKRILILDWDVHHGNGIQHCFESSPEVLYISLHVYKNANFFPYSQEADSHFVGKGPGRGFNINIPWNKHGMSDGDYISAFTQIVLPVTYQFDPDLVFVSAGFDAAVNDPLGGCSVTPECFGHLTHLLKPFANGKLILALEGGYNLNSISYCMAMCAKALLGDPLPSLNTHLSPSKSAVNTINEVIGIHKQFWSCFKFQVSFPRKKVLSTPYSPKIHKDEDSDGVFLTPPQSPSENNQPTTTTTTTTDSRENNGAKSKEVEPLVSMFSAMGLDGSSSPKSDPDESHLEGAVGMDDLSHFTIAQMLQDDCQLHAVVPLPWCPHLKDVKPVPECGIQVPGARCSVCNDEKENWQCLTCYTVLCGRYVREHMVEHGLKEYHNIVLSFADLSVWCYACESYVHNQVLNPAKRSAYWSKFGEEMPV